jgi:hypothetical protein
MKNLLPTLALAAALAPISLSSPTHAATAARSPWNETHKDERLGYQFRPPRGWQSIPLQTGEAWLAAKYVSDKTFAHIDEFGKTHPHKPQVMVIAFQHEVMARRKEVEVRKEDGVEVTTTKALNPYKDYEDFLDRTYAGGGWYLSEKEEAKQGKLQVTRYEIKVEKLARTGPKRIVTWVYHAEGVDFAMQFEVLEEEYRKLRRTLETSLKSLVEIERNAALQPSNTRAPGEIALSPQEVAALSPKERSRLRRTAQRELQDAVIANLAKGWRHRHHGEVLVLYHEESKWAKRVGEQVEAVLEYLDDSFEYIGEGEYVRAPIVRVCDDLEQAAAFSHGVVSGASTSDRPWARPGEELVTYKDDRGWHAQNSEVENVNRQLVRLWMIDRDWRLFSAIPPWLQIGLYEYVGGARQDGRKLEFNIDQYDRDEARQAFSHGLATSPRELVHLADHYFESSSPEVTRDSYWKRRGEATMFLHWLLDRDSSRCRQAKGLLKTYLATLDEVLDEEEHEGGDWQCVKTPETEEEEAELARTRAEALKVRQAERRAKTNERVFGDWSEGDWTNLKRQYYRWL